MTAEQSTRYLYLARHGCADGEEGQLAETGRRQAALLGKRLRGVPLSGVHHGPLPRAATTAKLLAEQLEPGIPVEQLEECGDYVPYFPSREELPADSADYLLEFLAQADTAEERERGPELTRRAMERFTGPVPGGTDRHELIVTHAFLVGWLLRDVMHAPKWRWLGLNAANAALTVIRYPPDRAPSVVVFNEQSHLPEDLRWTDFPESMRTV
jgi:probable phosphoglycerate mutase